MIERPVDDEEVAGWVCASILLALAMFTVVLLMMPTFRRWF